MLSRMISTMWGQSCIWRDVQQGVSGHTFQQFVLRRLQNVVNTRRPRIDLTTDSSHSSSISDFWQWNWVQDNDAIWKALRELQAGFSWDWREISDEFWQIVFVLRDWKTSFYSRCCQSSMFFFGFGWMWPGFWNSLGHLEAWNNGDSCITSLPPMVFFQELVVHESEHRAVTWNGEPLWCGCFGNSRF